MLKHLSASSPRPLWERPPGGFGRPRLSASLFEGEIAVLPAANHIFTHVVWEMTGYFIRLAKAPAGGDLVFVTPQELAQAYPLPSAFSAYKKYCK